ncbi:MAG TPA: glycosyltransferase family 4 protein [Anaerolineae bacterium]
MRILFVHNHPAKFVQIDLALLREKHEVTEWYQRSRWVNLIALTRAVGRADLIVGWFASWHTFFPVLFGSFRRRPSILMVGGYDTANMPEIAYGSQRGGFKKWVSQTVMRKATRLVMHSNYACAEAVKNAGLDENKITVIYLGLDGQGSKSNAAKENLVITVGNVDRINLQRKGLEPFVRAAALLPGIPFVLIGEWKDDAIDHLKSIATPNVEFTNHVSETELNNYLSRAQVYVQASRHEGFGLAVAEAMLRECVPVVTRAGALPEVVGEAGIYVDSTESSALAGAVRAALGAGDAQRRGARERIEREFPLERRREKLLALIDQLGN